MKRYVIVGRLGAGDGRSVPLAGDETGCRLDLLGPDGRLCFGIADAIKSLADMGLRPSTTGIDLLILAAHVYAADTRISRANEAQDGWTREIRLVVPVDNPTIWTAVRLTLERMLNFLTGDRWTVGFRPRPDDTPILAPDSVQAVLTDPPDSISLFSGGLDSLIGAIDQLESGGNPILVSHAGEGATSQAQEAVYAKLCDHYRVREIRRLRFWMSFPKGIFDGSSIEDTTRGRSFAFFALGVFAGSSLPDGFSLHVPENGLIAVNVPLDKLGLGALSTRTTHPFYIARWNELTNAIGLSGNIFNPYWNRTKGEMVAGCTNPDLLKNTLQDSMSCSSPTKGRWIKAPIQHCGYCLPCLIRRASVLSGMPGSGDPTTYTLGDLTERPLDPTKAEGVQVRSFQLAWERIQRNPGIEKFLIHKPGPLSDLSAADVGIIAGVYGRGLSEIGNLLNGVTTSHT